MKVKIQRIDIANAIIEGSIDTAEYSEKIDNIANKDLKSVKIDGFRPGKAPIAVIKKRFEKELKERTQQECIQDIFQDGLKQLGVSNDELLGEPVFDKFDSENNSIDVVLKVSLKPVFELKDYDTCAPALKIDKVSDKEIEERIKNIAKQHNKAVEVEGRDIVEDKDIAVIDFEGFVDDVAFEGGKGEDYPLEIGSKSFIDTFEEQLIGVKIKEEKEINVTFPKEYANQDLAGKKATFKVTVKSIQHYPEIEINDDLAKQLIPGSEDSKKEKPTVAKLKEEIKKTLLQEKKNAHYAEKKQEFFDALSEKFNDFALPENIVEAESVSLSNEKIRALKPEEIDELKNDKNKIDDIKNSVKDEAQKRVRLTFILEAMAKQEDVVVTDQHVMQAIYMDSMQAGKNPEEMLKLYKENNLMSSIKMALIEEKLIAKIFDKKINPKKEEK